MIQLAFQNIQEHLRHRQKTLSEEAGTVRLDDENVLTLWKNIQKDAVAFIELPVVVEASPVTFGGVVPTAQQATELVEQMEANRKS